MSDIRVSEMVLIVSGLLILVSVPIIYSSGNFTLWVYAKILYGIGVLIFVFDK